MYMNCNISYRTTREIVHVRVEIKRKQIIWSEIEETSLPMHLRLRHCAYEILGATGAEEIDQPRR